MNPGLPATVAPLASPQHSPVRGARRPQSGSGSDAGGDAKFELPAAGKTDGSGDPLQNSGGSGHKPGSPSHHHHAAAGGSAASAAAGTAMPMLVPVADPRNGCTTEQDMSGLSQADAGGTLAVLRGGATAPVGLQVHAFPIDEGAKPAGSAGAVDPGSMATGNLLPSAPAAANTNAVVAAARATRSTAPSPAPAPGVKSAAAVDVSRPAATVAAQSPAVGTANDHGVASILMQIGGEASRPGPGTTGKPVRAVTDADAAAVQAASSLADPTALQAAGAAGGGSFADSADADPGTGDDDDPSASQEAGGGKQATLAGGADGPSVPSVLLQTAAAAAGGTQAASPAPGDSFAQMLGGVAGGLVHATGGAHANNSATPSSPSSATQPGPLDTTQAGWADALGSRVQWVLHQGLQEARIDLHPNGMGSIQVHVRVGAEGADVRFAATNADVRQQLEGSLPRLREMLASGGLQLSQAQVGAQMQQDSAPGFTPRPAAPRRDSGASRAVDTAAPVQSQRVPVVSLSLIDDYA